MKRTIFSLAAVAVFVSALSGCGNGQQSGQDNAATGEAAMKVNLSQFTVSSASGNPTLFFSLVKSTETDSSKIYLAQALNEKDTLGLQIEVAKNIEAGVFADGTVNEEKAFTEGTIKFSSLGQESDTFVKALSIAYKQPSDKGMVATALEPTVFSSNKQKVDLSTNETYAFKFSFDNLAGQDAEAFAELNLYNRSLKFWAKDAAQYTGLLSAFTGE